MRNINEIIIHCTATPEGKEFTLEQIRKWHLKRGWNDIGYHYVIHLDGRVEAGRPLSLPGAHCHNHNADSIGICYIGGMAAQGKHFKNTMTPAQEAALVGLCRELCEAHPALWRPLAKGETASTGDRLVDPVRITQKQLENPGQFAGKILRLNIHGHNEYSMKRCPCFDVQEERVKWGI